MLERRLLQAAVALGGLIPVGAGLAGALFGTDFVGEALGLSGESHFRYLSGLLLAIGLAFWSTIPGIESRSGRFRLLTGIVFVGGLARLYALLTEGVPSLPMQVGLMMELVVTPLLCIWQGRVAGMTRASP